MKYFLILLISLVSFPLLAAEKSTQVEISKDYFYFAKLAKKFFDEKKYKDAVTNFNTAFSLIKNTKKKDKHALYIYYYRGTSFFQMKKYNESLADFTYVEKYLNYSYQAIATKFQLALYLKKPESAYHSVINFVQTHPEEINKLKIKDFWRAYRLLAEKHQDLQLHLMEALFQNNYQSDKPDKIEYFHSTLIEQYLDNNDIAKAESIIRNITKSDIIIEMTVDRRYEPFWNKKWFIKISDPNRHIPANLKSTKNSYMENLRDLDKMMTYLDMLRFVGDNEQIIKRASPVLEKMDRYSHNEKNVLWFQNLLADAYQDNGQFEKANTILEKIFTKPASENGTRINQHINYSLFLLFQGNFKKSLKVANSIDPKYTSDYGKGFLNQVKACSLHELGRNKEADLVVNKMLETPDHNYPALAFTLLCFEQSEKLLSLYKERIADKKYRYELAMVFQNYKKHDSEPPFFNKLMDRFEKFKKKPSLLKILNPYFIIIDVPIYRTYWGNL